MRRDCLLAYLSDARGAWAGVAGVGTGPQLVKPYAGAQECRPMRAPTLTTDGPGAITTHHRRRCQLARR